MSKAGPYVPWFHGDFLRSTAGWTLQERGAYWMLLCAQWEIGPLPNNPVRLASIIGIEQSEMASLWPTLAKKFKHTKSGLVNVRMEAHRRNYLEYRRHLSESGRKGAAKRWKRGNVVQFPSSGGAS
ncbi:MAG TPA: DUF1376 domain-containing protein [Steroidobacteraceae bacterium]|nr:DUF1376 domain-containing protein [Steroidobacteraceae bacterium]